MSEPAENALTVDQTRGRAASWQVCAASPKDIAQIAAAVRELLVELGGTPPPQPSMEDAARALVEDPGMGVALVAEAGDTLIGVLVASWQAAIHIPGPYALIQDLWVHPPWRSEKVGSALLAALCDLAREQQIARIEVGLPRESFAGVRATERFYSANGFTPLGPRMRRKL